MKKENQARYIRGEKLLESLDSLAPDLIAGADREPEPHERGHSFSPGTWIAVAACLMALCLPITLPVLIDNGVFEAGSGGDRGGDMGTSHESGYIDEYEEYYLGDMDGAWYGEGQARLRAEEEREQAASSEQARLRVEEGELDEYSEIYNKDYSAVSSEYESAYITIPDSSKNSSSTIVITVGQGEKLRAEDYFSCNSQGVKNQILEADTAEPHNQEALFTYDEWAQNAIPKPEGFVSYESPFISGNYDRNGSLTALHIAWNWWRQIDAHEVADNMLLLNISPEPIVSQDWEIRYKQAYGETIVKRDGLEISALGGLDTPRAISFQKDGWCYRIYGTWAVTPECMVGVLDQLLDKGLDVEAFELEKGHIQAIEPLSQHPDAFKGFYPDGHDWCRWDPDKCLVWLDNDEAYMASLQPYRGYSDPIDSIELRDPSSPFLPADARFNECSLGDLYEITERKLFDYYSSMYPAYKQGFTLYFTWEGYNVTVYFNDNLESSSFSEVMGFIEFLQRSDSLKGT